jgi:hypothetical protein
VDGREFAYRTPHHGKDGLADTTAQVDEATAILEAWSSVDEDLAELNGNQKQFRLSEARAYIEAMNQEMAQTLFYGNQGTAPEEFTGLAPRYSSLSAGNADNIIDASGASTDNYSIWLIVWGEQTAFMTFPKGSKAGLVHNDLGIQTVQTNTTVMPNQLRAYQDQWKWKCGFVLKDWRYVVRIANIDVSDLVGLTSAPDLTELMIKAMYRVPNLRLGTPAFYMNRTTIEKLDILRRRDVEGGGGLTYENIDGKRVMSFRGVPIRLCDQLVTETTAVT